MTTRDDNPERQTLDLVLGLGSGAAQRRATLRARIAQRRAFVVPGVTDAMGAVLVTELGFDAAYVTGAGLANAQYGLPDIGLLGLTDLAGHVDRLSFASGLPLIVDADTGFGGPVAVARAVRSLERAGAAAMQIEDQEMPKRCGHFDSHRLIPAGHMQAKIAAAVQAREDKELVLIARTDAVSAYGIDEAIRRGKAYADAGADVVFVEAPRTVDDLKRIGAELSDVPLVVNVVEGGKTPQLSLVEYDRLGFTLVLYANFLLRTLMRAGKENLAHLRVHGDTLALTDDIATWEERQQLFRLPEFTAAEAFYDRPFDGQDVASLASNTGENA